MSKSDPNAPYMNLFDPWFLASQLPAAIGHREQTLIEKIRRLEARAKLWKRCAHSYRSGFNQLTKAARELRLQIEEDAQYFEDMRNILDEGD